MQIEIDGYVFDINVKHYEPAIPGSFAFDAASDVDYYGYAPELDFDVESVHSEYPTVEALDSHDAKEIVDEYYSHLYDSILKVLEAENEYSF